MDVMEIASMSTALSMAKVQNEVGIRVLKIAQDQQGQVVASLLASAVETATEIAQQTAGDAGANIDLTA